MTGFQFVDENEYFIKANSRWGLWRRFIATHPLRATWIMFGIGAALGWAAGRIHLPF